MHPYSNPDNRTHGPRSNTPLMLQLACGVIFAVPAYLIRDWWAFIPLAAWAMWMIGNYGSD